MPDAESGIFFEIVMNKNKIIVLLIALVAVFAYNKMQNKQLVQSQNQQKIEAVQNKIIRVKRMPIRLSSKSVRAKNQPKRF